MAISPKDAARINDEENERLLKNARASVDNQLSKKWYTGCDKIYINPPSMSPKVRNVLLEEYKLAGWKITISTDQRDGTYWEFKV
jgi:hypothetical protein